MKLVHTQRAAFTTSVGNTAASELGEDSTEPTPALMRKYVERRMVVGEHRPADLTSLWRVEKNYGFFCAEEYALV